MKKRFRISANDTIKATLTINRQLVSSLYDSGFTTKNEVFNILCSKVHYKGLKGECNISIPEKMKSISFAGIIK